jgi:ParB family transcriptional regulator, chromosome partitioning protein
MAQFYNDSIFWIDVDKIHPNPFQPRREFDMAQLQSLADSIRQYGVLQALVVTRKEVPKDDGGLAVEYELIAGERRLRAAKIAGLSQVPCLIKVGDEENDLLKLELAIIENIQREDLNPVDRSRAFQRLIEEFGFKHVEIAKKVGKSREYVSNSVRLLSLPPEILNALSQGKISEGHARPLMMLGDRLDEQMTLFKEIMFRKLTVREAEAIGRRIAYDKIRKKGATLDPETQELEEKLTETLGTRVSIEKRENGGKILIDFFSNVDLRDILELIKTNKTKSPTERLDNFIEKNPIPPKNEYIPEYIRDPNLADMTIDDLKKLDDRTPEQKNQDENSEEKIYSIKNFSI